MLSRPERLRSRCLNENFCVYQNLPIGVGNGRKGVVRTYRERENGIIERLERRESNQPHDWRLTRCTCNGEWLHVAVYEGVGLAKQ
jgi:hypothetical protein